MSGRVTGRYLGRCSGCPWCRPAVEVSAGAGREVQGSAGICTGALATFVCDRPAVFHMSRSGSAVEFDLCAGCAAEFAARAVRVASYRELWYVPPSVTITAIPIGGAA